MTVAVEQIREKFTLTERRAFRLLLVPVSSFRYQPQRRDDELRERLIELARKQPRYGYRRLRVLLARDLDQPRASGQMVSEPHRIKDWRVRYQHCKRRFHQGAGSGFRR
jgi:hypothetical protein